MFGKNDELVDQNYQHTAAPHAAQDTSFGSVGGDFMSAAAPQPQAEMPAAAPDLDFSQQQAPTFAAPVQPVEAAAVEAPAEDMPPIGQTPDFDTPVPESMSFSARFGNSAPAAAVPAAIIDEPAVMGEGAPANVAPEAFVERPQPAPTFSQAPDLSQVAGDSAMSVVDAAPEEEAPSAQDAFGKASAALQNPEVQSAGGKTRIQAVALDSLVTRAQGGDEKATAQLHTHGFELLEKLADGLPAGSQALDAVVNAAAALIDEGHVAPADSKAQQTEALQVIATGVNMQGQAAARTYNDASQAAQQQAAAQAERARPKTHAEILESAREANARDAENGMGERYL